MYYPDDFVNKVIHGDCLKIMPEIRTHSIDMILCDLPYGKTVCEWDTILPVEPLWSHYKRIIKDNGAIVLMAEQPLASELIMSNLEMFKYRWIWLKSNKSNFLNVKKQPMRQHELVLVFYKKQCTYNPQGVYKLNKFTMHGKNSIYSFDGSSCYFQENTGYPSDVIDIKNHPFTKLFHPSQKPLPLFKYLVKTYTNKGDIVLDNCMGLGTTPVACKELGRDFIGIEKELEFYKKTIERLKETDDRLKENLGQLRFDSF